MKTIQKKYTVTGMTCQGCRASVEEALQGLNNVVNADVDLLKEEANIEFKEEVSVAFLQQKLGKKYTISTKEDANYESFKNNSNVVSEDSKLKQLQPLFLIFFYIITASFLMNWKEFDWQNWMLDFMGMFYIVFSFFKFLDYKGFPNSFRMYDPLAKKVPIYAWLYPFLETALGLCFLFKFQIEAALVATLVILGITTVGVSQSLFLKKKIKCACLGTALNLPMTEATFIENTIMITMAVAMLF